jgi:hydroxycarboxylate dehydrogenase B
LPVEAGDPIVADFSTSVVPEGVVRSLRNRGLAAPPGALRDANGHDTSDPATLYATPRGSIQPFGGPVGYRGTALGILVEALAALLGGDDADDPSREGSDLALIAIAAGADFARRASQMASYLRSSPPRDPNQPVALPGERERSQARRAAADPILVDAPTWRAMIEWAGKMAIPVPAATEA